MATRDYTGDGAEITPRPRTLTNQYLMIDSTIVRAHQQAASGKGGRGIRRWGVPEAG